MQEVNGDAAAGAVYTNGATDKNGETVPVNEHMLEDYVQPGSQQLPRAIPDVASKALLHLLRLAIATGKPPFVIVALSTIQQVVAAGFVQGEIASLIVDGEGRSTGEQSGMLARGLSMCPEKLSIPSQALHLVCACEDCCSDEDVEVRLTKHSTPVLTGRPHLSPGAQQVSAQGLLTGAEPQVCLVQLLQQCRVSLAGVRLCRWRCSARC